jgi:hypothetical protein
MTESKNIKDYLHLYLGCECMIGDLNWKPETNLHGLAPGVDPNYGKPIKSKIDAHVLNVFAHKTTLILRPLSDMTDEEMDEVWYSHEPKNVLVMDYKNNSMSRKVALCSERTRYLLSKGFDLFGLIDSGLAIDKIKLNP